jgi:hypothetical protein
MKRKYTNAFKEIQEGLWNIHQLSRELSKKLQQVCPHTNKIWKDKAQSYYCEDCELWITREEK